MTVQLDCHCLVLLLFHVYCEVTELLSYIGMVQRWLIRLFTDVCLSFYGATLCHNYHYAWRISPVRCGDKRSVYSLCFSQHIFLFSFLWISEWTSSCSSSVIIVNWILCFPSVLTVDAGSTSQLVMCGSILFYTSSNTRFLFSKIISQIDTPPVEHLYSLL